ncbi:MAG: NADPH-dependent F420 reductase [Dehalococcoidia bacterium]|nr:NADPH-dependent F420 reductase [Dehalococcoidia bacterium]
MLAFVGGTGPHGRGLALRLAMAGEHVLVGSRDVARAKAAADELNTRLRTPAARGLLNAEAVAQAEVVFLCVPYQSHHATLAELAPHLEGKVLVDVVAPLAFSRGRVRAIQVEEGSAAEQAHALAPGARVVGAFHNLSAEDLLLPDRSMDCDVVVCSDDQEAKRRVMALAEKIKGIRGVDGGPLEYSRYVEQFTALLITINRTYKSHTSIRIVGI